MSVAALKSPAFPADFDPLGKLHISDPPPLPPQVNCVLNTRLPNVKVSVSCLKKQRTLGQTEKRIHDEERH